MTAENEKWEMEMFRRITWWTGETVLSSKKIKQAKIKI